MLKQLTDHQSNATGDCFKRAFDLITSHNVEQFIGTPYLVHGIVYHEATGWHAHAWVEDSFFCYDFLRDQMLTIEKSEYYILGRIKTGADEIKRYRRAEAIGRALKTNLYYFSNLPCNQ